MKPESPVVSNVTPLHMEEILPRGGETFHVLANVQLASAWNILSDCDVRELQAGEVLLAKDQANDTLFMVLGGTLEVHLESVSDKALASLRAGETVGEISVIDGSPASAFVMAAEPTRLLAIDKEAFFGLVRTSHAFAVNIMLLLAERMRSNNFSLTRAVQLQRQFMEEALTDGLTGLHNRRWLEDMLPRLLGRHQREARPLSVMMMDIDFFKKINDTRGHTVGDLALRHVAQQIQGNLRPLDLAARYGGEEFAVLLPETDLQGGIAAAQRLRKAIENSPALVQGEERVCLTVSVGLAQARRAMSAEALLQEADSALYEAKRQGRNRVVAKEPT